MSQFTSLVLTIGARIRTAGDEENDAMIRHASPRKGKGGGFDIVELGNSVPNRWVLLTKGTEVTLCAFFRKTDTYLLAVQEPSVGDQTKPVYGMVLREMSFQNLVAAATEPTAKQLASAAKAEAPKAESKSAKAKEIEELKAKLAAFEAAQKPAVEEPISTETVVEATEPAAEQDVEALLAE